MPKKGYKWSIEEKEKRSVGMLLAYKKNPLLRNYTGHPGKSNGRYIDGHTMQIKYCVDCGKKKSWKGVRCRKCAMKKNRKKYSWVNKYHSSVTKNKIGIKSKVKFTDEYKKKQRKTFEKLGLWIPLKNIKPYVLYRKEAGWIERMFNYMSLKELKLLSEKGLFSSQNTKGMVRDHKYSRYSGFKNKIPSVLLRHPVNCQLITHAENLSKAKKNHRYKDGDSIILKQLFNLIMTFKQDWSEQRECLVAMKNYKENAKMVTGGKK